MKMTVTTAVTILAALALGSARAGLLDGGPGAIDGVPSQVVYRIAPVYVEPGLADTLVSCTNHDIAAAHVALEWFDDNDRPAGRLVSANVAAEATVTFASSQISGRANVVVVSTEGRIGHGKARISATTTRLACTAFHHVSMPDGGIKEDAVSLVKYVAHNTNY
ncbi:MAG TPA: hypothetical protein VE046_00835 [Steroidobacteraceae bacterium]|nr:hypothetical protein [Steroidobacteraceae bacterium]